MLLWTAITMAAQNGPSPTVVVFGNLSIAGGNAANGNYAIGQAWKLNLVDAPADASFAICAQMNADFIGCTPAFGVTDLTGAWSMQGTFDASAAGSWTEWLQFPSGAMSSRVSFSVGSAPPVTLSIAVNGSQNPTPAVGQQWVIVLSGAPADTPFSFCASVGMGASWCTPQFGTTNANGTWMGSGVFGSSAIGGWTEWAQFPSGALSNQISFTVGTVIKYAPYGLAFSPYLPGQDPADGISVTTDQIYSRLGQIAPYITWVGTYGFTGGLENIGPVARQFGLKTAIGIWLGPDDAANQQEIANGIAAANNGYADMLVVGNEVLLRGDLSESQLLAYIAQVHKAVPQVKITTADTYAVLMQHPNIVAACDVIMVHYYPYRDGKDVNHAIASLDGNDIALRARYPQKDVIVGETGWPSGGGVNGSAVASSGNAAYYFLDFISWARASNRKFFYFEAFDEAWRISEDPQGPYWGIWDQNANLKTGMANVFAGETLPNNWSASSSDTTPPTAPTGLVATAASANEIDLSWSAASDNVAVTQYKVFRNGAGIALTSGTTYRDAMLQPATDYGYYVVAYDAAGNASPASTTAAAKTYATTSSVDTTPPTVPMGLTATVASSTQVNLSWNPSTDNVAVAGYDVYRDGYPIAVTTATQYQDTGLDVGTSYSYTVDAYDAAGNVSAQSAPATAIPACFTIPGGAGTPSITFTYVPPLGSSDNLTGQVLHVSAASYYVAVFIRVLGVWWTKPFWDAPETSINCDGTWVSAIDTGGIDETADEIAAYVLPMTYSVPLAYGDSSSVPDGVAANAVASFAVSR